MVNPSKNIYSGDKVQWVAGDPGVHRRKWYVSDFASICAGDSNARSNDEPGHQRLHKTNLVIISASDSEINLS